MNRFLKTILMSCQLAVLLMLPAARVKSSESADVLKIPKGPAIKLDGHIAPAEWKYAATVHIAVSPDWDVKVLAQHDEQNLYLAFIGLRHGTEERYPEILIDPDNRRNLLWNGGQWWLHASYNLCEGREPNQYSTCKPTQEGWQATRFPRVNGVSEIAISLAKPGLAPQRAFEIAFDVTDTHKAWSFWPADADLEKPASWRPARLE